MKRWLRQLLHRTGQHLLRYGSVLVHKAGPLPNKVPPAVLDGKTLWMQRVSHIPASAWQGPHAARPLGTAVTRGSRQPPQPSDDNALTPARPPQHTAAPERRPSPIITSHDSAPQRRHLETPARTPRAGKKPFTYWREEVDQQPLKSAHFPHVDQSSSSLTSPTAADREQPQEPRARHQTPISQSLEAPAFSWESDELQHGPPSSAPAPHPGASIWSLDTYTAIKSKLNVLGRELSNTASTTPKFPTRHSLPETTTPFSATPAWPHFEVEPPRSSDWALLSETPVSPTTRAGQDASPPSPWPDLPPWPGLQAGDTLESRRVSQQRLQRLNREQTSENETQYGTRGLFD